MIVAVDGPAGSGKSTVSKETAARLSFNYLNSGNIYRAFTVAAIRAGIDLRDSNAVLRTARTSSVSLQDGRVHLGNEDIHQELHTDAVDRWVSPHSAVPALRDLANTTIRTVVGATDAIVEGRDIGTVVFPDAELKIYLDASIEIRADRRYRQGTSQMTRAQIRESIAERDCMDREKAVGSLKKAPDAHLIDTSHLTIDDVCDTLVKLILKVKCEKSPGR